MTDAEQVMNRVWGCIIGEVRKMREEKYTLERIGSILGVAKPTVQRWLENNAGGEKTAFIDILRYLNALDIDLKELINEPEESIAPQTVEAALLESAKAENTRLSSELISAQRELLEAREKIIALQDKMLELEKYSAEVAEKTRRALVAATASKKAEAAAPAAKRRLSPAQFPDLPPIHLQRGNE
ncbi:hypothetical protein LJB93_00805 [Desulfovibrio sp. OttesenSCG-928-F07]|nr:hypothetical protein [Desulfovibrio sp. OttesenSCG-928-F07]